MNPSGEFVRMKPEVFDRPDLERLIYAETRRNPHSTDQLSGNIGSSDVILAPENHSRTNDSQQYQQWRQTQLTHIAQRIQIAQDTFGLDSIGAPRVEHKSRLANLDNNADSFSVRAPLTLRGVSDASIFTKEGVGSLYAPADCGIVTFALPAAELVGQIHVGIRGATHTTIPRIFGRIAKMGYNPGDAVAYVAPHAKDYPMNQVEFNDVYKILKEQSAETKDEFLRSTSLGPTGYPVMHISDMLERQLIRSGLHSHNIQVSTASTLDNPELFSHHDTETTGAVNGRFGVLIGKMR